MDFQQTDKETKSRCKFYKIVCLPKNYAESPYEIIRLLGLEMG